MSELFHGPTASFKDFPLQQLPHFYRLANSSHQDGRKTFILVATSGDTGGATLDGFQRLQSDNTEVVVLYPENNTSELQAQQMLSYHKLPKANVIGDIIQDELTAMDIGKGRITNKFRAKVQECF